MLSRICVSGMEHSNMNVIAHSDIILKIVIAEQHSGLDSSRAVKCSIIARDWNSQSVSIATDNANFIIKFQRAVPLILTLPHSKRSINGYEIASSDPYEHLKLCERHILRFPFHFEHGAFKTQ
ncbi:hypothetical protein NPIL_118831 [Nephila pilipes]|uniref:Uncharacterized protein n=1 Tax=Nephila pilipes TaxID=299642 RepID=A0A8X6K8Q1_NEPPI|nr:hypothetical protein NPIL_118831 [Nephila pilipes]